MPKLLRLALALNVWQVVLKIWRLPRAQSVNLFYLSIEAVTQGTLSQQTIMQQANNAMLLGVADTADEFSTLAKIAVDRGRAMGISMEYAFESIVKVLTPLTSDSRQPWHCFGC